MEAFAMIRKGAQTAESVQPGAVGGLDSLTLDYNRRRTVHAVVCCDPQRPPITTQS